MKISEIVIPKADQSNSLSQYYNSDTIINGYYWMDYLTDSDRKCYFTTYSNDCDNLIYQIKKILRIKQINEIINDNK